MRRVTIAVVLVSALSIAGACGDGEDRPGSGSASGSVSGSVSGTGSASGAEGASFEEADADTVVHATTQDFEIGGVPETVKGQKVYFEVENKGPSKHEFYVIGSDGKTVSEIHEIDAGKSESKGIELKAGTYTAECRIATSDGKTHADLGMKRSFKVE